MNSDFEQKATMTEGNGEAASMTTLNDRLNDLHDVFCEIGATSEQIAATLGVAIELDKQDTTTNPNTIEEKLVHLYSRVLRVNNLLFQTNRLIK